MRTVGTLAALGVLLIVLQLIWAPWSNDAPWLLRLAPLLVGLALLAIAAVIGAVRGPAAVRLTVGLGMLSVAGYVFAISSRSGGRAEAIGATVVAMLAVLSGWRAAGDPLPMSASSAPAPSPLPAQWDMPEPHLRSEDAAGGTRFRLPGLGAIAGGIILGLGAFASWISVSPLAWGFVPRTGMEDGDGWLVVALAGALVVAGLDAVQDLRQRTGLLTAGVGMVALVVCGLEYAKVQGTIDSAYENFGSVGIGIYIMALGAIVAVVSGVAMLPTSRRESSR